MSGTTLADQLIEVLLEARVRRIYGVAGDSLNPVVNAVQRADGIEWVHVRNEEAGAFAAAAEAQLTGRLAVCAGSCGPGRIPPCNARWVPGLRLPAAARSRARRYGRKEHIMNEAEIRAAERDCTRLIAGYCQAADTDDVQAFVGLFTDDAEWIRPDGSTMTGHDAIRENFAGRPAGVVSAHLSSNVLVEVTGPDSATGRSLTTVYRGSAIQGGPALLSPPVAVLENRDEFALTEQGWRIRRRRSRMILANHSPRRPAISAGLRTAQRPELLGVV